MAVPSTMLPLGTPAPYFALPDLDGRTVSRGDFADARALLVMFVCNHCPYVEHVEAELGRIGREYGEKGVGVVAIMPNDVTRYPDDGPEGMRAQKERAGFTFPYLYDETQQVARAYDAACTPDLFLFAADGGLAYRGQLDDARPGNEVPVTGRDLRAALDAVIEGRPLPEDQRPSLGCGVKWRG